MSDERLAELMAAYQRGDVIAFEELFRALKPRLRQYLQVLTRQSGHADDLLQDTFLQMHRSRHTYLPGRPVVPWTFAIARHVYLTNLRRRSRVDRREASGLDVLPEIPVPPEVEGLADSQRLQQALGGLPADQAEALTLHHVWGFSFQEIGATLGIRAVTAKVRAFRGMKRLRRVLEAEVKPDGAEGRSSVGELIGSERKRIGRR